MTEPNKANEYHEKQYPKQRLRFYQNKIRQIIEDCEPAEIAEAILLLKNANIEDVELINQAVVVVGK
jgi:hypothetical protein